MEPPGAGPRAPIGIFPRSQAEFGATSAEGRPRREPEPKSGEDIFAEDWWSHARPVFEIHGYFRTRGELLHNFSLGRVEDPNIAVWPQPTDNVYSIPNGATYGPGLCTLSGGTGTKDADNPAAASTSARTRHRRARTQVPADPELHVSDNLRAFRRSTSWTTS